MKTYGILIVALMLAITMPMVMATSIGSGVGVSINTEKFAPKIWMCGDRVFADDNVQDTSAVLTRQNNYAFEGESIHWSVLVMDKNKIEEVQDVVGTIGDTQGTGNDVEVECKRATGPTTIPDSCNARIDEEKLTTFKPETMAYYDCQLTVETPASMHGQFFITVEAKSTDGEATMDENEFWFLNPEIALNVDGDLTFDDVRPGTDAYSSTLLVGNDAEAGSGVVLDMFVSGTDFYDPASSGAACPTTNQLALTNFRYFATNGAYQSATIAGADDEGYLLIAYGDRIDQAMEILGDQDFPAAMSNTATAGNTLTPGAEMALTFKLSMPEPCVGDFSEGQILFWGEAI